MNDAINLLRVDESFRASVSVPFAEQTHGYLVPMESAIPFQFPHQLAKSGWTIGTVIVSGTSTITKKVSEDMYHSSEVMAAADLIDWIAESIPKRFHAEFCDDIRAELGVDEERAFRLESVLAGWVSTALVSRDRRLARGLKAAAKRQQEKRQKISP